MKRLTMLLALLLALASLTPAPAEGEPEKALTLMIYMCGSNLESQYGSACADIEEMRASGVDAEAVNVLLLTGGSARWHTGQGAGTVEVRSLRPSRRSGENRWAIEKTLPARSMGDAQTLTDFLGWGVRNYPAQQYALILWDHGAGPLEGICLDELNAPDRLGVDELARALERAKLPGKLSWIGMDACLMATAEVAKAVSPYAEYMIASQETEPADGWDYAFLKGIEDDGDGAATGRRVVDGYFESQGGDAPGLTLSCLDLSRIDDVEKAMNGFFEPIGRSMDNDTFARLSVLRTQSASFGRVVRGLTADGYDLVDLGDLINHYGALGKNQDLKWALASAVTYKRPGGKEYSGLSVYHPLRNKAGYQQGWKQRYARMDFSEGYQKYLNSFGTLLTGKELADWSGIALSDDGFNAAGENLYSLQLTPLQRENFASAQLILLGAVQSGGGEEAVYDAQMSRLGAATGSEQFYYPVLIDEVSPDEGGMLSARYTGRSLYLTDESGNAVAGPIGCQRSDDGEYWYIRARYYDRSGREDAADSASVLYTCALDETDGALKVVNTEVYDALTQTYTRRIGFDEADYTEMDIERLARSVPGGEGALPGFADWKEIYSTVDVALPLKWQLRFFDEQLSGTPLFATLQITDVQQNSYCTPPIRVENPNLYNIDVLPRQIVGNGFELTLYAVQDSSPLSPGLNIAAAFKNTSHQAMRCEITDIVLNGHREASGIRYISMYNVAPGKTAYDSGHLDRTELAGLGELTELSFELRTNLIDTSTSEETRSVQSVRLSGCDASVMGSEATVPLDEVVRGEATWQLLALRRNARGGLSGTLRVVNDSDRMISEFCYIVLNDRLQTDERHYLSIGPHMDGIVPLEISNSVYGKDLTITTGQGTSYRYMGIDHLMEHFGITEVTSLKLCAADSKTPFADGIAFEWAEPIPVADPGKALCQPLGQAQRLLLDGDFTVNVDRLMVAEDGVAFRLLVTNRTGRDLKFEIKHPTRNGGNAYLAGVHEEMIYAVGAGATLVANLAVGKDKSVAVEEVGLCFRYGDFTTHSGSVLLDAPGFDGSEGVTYLSGEDIRTVPADNARTGVADVAVAPASVDIAGASLSLSATLTNGAGVYTLAAVDGSAVLVIGLRVENLSEDVLHFDFDECVVNGTRSVGASAYISDMKPGNGGSCALEIKGLELAGLDRVSTVDCQVTVRRNGDWKSEKAYPLHLDVSGISLAGVIPGLEDALGEGKAGDISLRLMSLREDGEQLKGLLYLRNDADAPLEEHNVSYFVNGIKGGLVAVGLPGRTDRVVGFTYDNRLDASYTYNDFGGKRFDGLERLLQRMGMDAVESVGLLLDENSADSMATATLETPLPLSPCEAADMAAPKPLMEGKVSVGVTHAIMLDNSLCLTLVLRNDSPEEQRLEICGADADGCAIEPYMGFYYLAPGVTQVSSAILLTDKSMRKGKPLEAVNLSFAVGGELAEGAAIRLDGPMTLGRAELRNAEAFEVTPARPLRPMPVILEAIGVPEAQNVYTATLVAPVDAGEVARFDHGEAVVCLRGEEYAKDAAGEMQKRPCLRQVCRIPLAIDGGRLAAPFSGMVLLNGYDVLLTRQTPLEGGGTELRVGLALSPRTARSGEAASSDQPAQRERDTLEGRWMVDATGDGPVRLDGGWTPGRPDATGDPGTLLAKDWNTYSESTLYFGEGVPDVTDLSFVDAPKRMTLVPVQMLDGAFAVRYEIFYKDGDSETITVDDDLAAIRQAVETGGVLSELEPEGGGCIAVTPDVYQADRFRVSVSARLMLEDDPDAGYDNPIEPQIRLGLCVKVENPTDLTIDAVSTNLVLNGAHETDTKWVALRIGPASACVDTWYIEPEDLRAVGSVRRIQCTLNLSETNGNGGILESIPIDVTLPPMDEAALWRRYGEAGETGVYGVTWQLLSAEVDRYGRVSGTLKAVNHTNNTWSFSGNAVLANGYRGTSVLEDFELEPHGSKSVRYAFENFVWTRCREGDDGEAAQTLFILQSHGVQAVEELTFELGMEYDSHADRVQPKQTLAFELPAPLAVPPTDYIAGPQKLLMQEGGLSVWLESVLLGDENLSIALEVRNDTDELYDFEPDHVCLDGNFIFSAYWESYDYSTVLPHTVQNCCFSADLWDYDPSARSEIRDIHLCFWVKGAKEEAHIYRAAQVRLGEAPAQTGDVVRAGDCQVRPATFAGAKAPGLADALCLPPAARVRPRTLTPPIDGERAALFEGGEASICIRQEWDDPDTPELKSCRTLSREIVSLPLRRDAGSGVCAEYSGMALAFWASPFPMREQTRDGESDIDATVYLLRDYYDAYKVRDPGTDGQTPDVAPVGEPSYVTEEPVAPAVKAGLAYRVGRDGDGLACRDAKVAFVDMDTGKALAGGVTDWMYHSMMICNAWRDDDYAHTLRLCMEFGGNAAHYPCLIPVEHFAGEYWDDAELVVRYHIQYADGTEEILTEPY